MLDLRTVYECNRCLGCKTLHPQVGIINLENPSLEEDAVKFEFYAVLLIEDCMGHRTKRFFQWSGKMGERF